MTTRLMVVLPLSALLALSACQPPPVTFTREDEASIETLATSYRQFILSRDYDAWAALFAEDAVYMVPNATVLQGRSAIRASLNDLPTPPSEMTVSLTTVQGSGDVAWAWGTYAYTMPAVGDTASATEIGKFLWGLKRQPSGEWLIGAEAFNADTPVEASGG